MKALSSAQQSEVKAWEEEIIPCEHALTLEQMPLITPGEGQFLRQDSPIDPQSLVNAPSATSNQTCGSVSLAVSPTAVANSSAASVATVMLCSTTRTPVTPWA